MYKRVLVLCCCALPFLTQAQKRIVSLSGPISEMLCALGMESSIVGVDVTSTYPASLQQKPKVGHNRNISAENILSLQPDLVMGVEEQINPTISAQLKAAGVRVALYRQEFSLNGTIALLQQVGGAVQKVSEAGKLAEQLRKESQAVKVNPTGKKVVFVYARGAGSLSVAGINTPMDKMIREAGAVNPIPFSEYKPLTTEALVAADPDVLLLFTSGLQSVGGVEGFLKLPGVSLTKAGKQRKIIAMDGELLSGFGLRLPKAIAELNAKIVQ